MRLTRFLYIYSLIFVFVIPVVIQWYFLAGQISGKSLVWFMVAITILGSLWDIWAARHGSKDRIWLWQFNKKDTIGFTVFDLPIEEYLFYVVSSVYVIFGWESLNLLIETPFDLSHKLFLGAMLWSLFFIGLPYFVEYRRKARRRK